ncbi:hypothetical protein [Solicola sp. PLA-1-18]|uniref:hypothetical protein n=1 Tax=Solicola sp. PLA-1-18 TaxID=3380532 RepID=UPI003B7C0B0C
MTTNQHLTFLEAEATSLLRLLEKAAQASPDHTTKADRRRLVSGWILNTDRFTPAALLDEHGDASCAAHLTALCTNGDYSPARWRIARKQFTGRPRTT